MFLSLLLSLSTALAITPGVSCEFYTLPVAGCGPDTDTNVANCVVVKNPTAYYAEVGIKGICPVGSGASVARPAGGIPTFVDGTPADPTTGARNVIEPYSDAYIFIRPDPTSPTWELPTRLKVEAQLFSLVVAAVVNNAQFVPGYTAIATPTSGGPVSAGKFCQPIDMRPPFNVATIRRENFCD